jgi:hypothetical protein
VPDLFDPKRHEPLAGDPWDASYVRDTLETIARDAVAARDSGFWARHPLDGDAPELARSLYFGSAGVLWALDLLTRKGVVTTASSTGEWALEVAAGGRRLAADQGAEVASYFVGAPGVLLVGLVVGGDTRCVDALHTLLEGHVDHPTREAFLGSAGAMVAAVFAYEITGDERWRSLFRSTADSLIAAWGRHPADRFDLWTQDLYGAKRRLLGASHGFAGNVHALLRGWDLLDESQRLMVAARAEAALVGTAIRDGALASWPISAGGSTCLVHWCHGAPGMLTSFRRAPSRPVLDETLIHAGELVWRAGPLRKGPSLCHGTAGNGEALLALYSRTGDELWLDRARRFAMHGIRQVEAARARYGRGRYTLWTGDLGVAVYLWQCIDGTSGMPSLDF